MPVKEHCGLPWANFCLGFILATSSAIAVDWPQLRFTQIAGGSTAPTSMADDGSGRLFVTEQSGRVMLVQSDGLVPFLDLRLDLPDAGGRRFNPMRDFGRPQSGTGGTLQFQYNNVPPIPLRRIFRIKATEDPNF